jgi:hypothetical protein
MSKDEAEGDVAASPAIPGESRFSRRQAIGRMSLFATAGAAAWVAPEILTAKPAGGATLSAPGVVTDPSTLNGTLGAPVATVPTPGTATVPTPGTATVPTPGTTNTNTLAFTGLNIQRDAEVGAALLAGGWAMHHWTSRTSTSTSTSTSTPPARGPGAPA